MGIIRPIIDLKVVHMLSYRHGFHAGNHADVMKHWVCVLTASYMVKKDKPFYYIDTHSGTGLYSLYDSIAKKTNESQGGIQTLWDEKIPAVFKEYMAIINQLNPGERLKNYPGSPWFVRHFLRPSDRAKLFELHPQDFQVLRKNFANDKIVSMEKVDGFVGLKALLPPPPKRAMVVIDPPYEQAKEYQMVVAAVEQALKRFPTGVYLVWYPLINRNDKQKMSETMARKLKNLKPKSFLDVRFWVSGDNEEQGMYGSGLAIMNPPWDLEQKLNEGLPYLVDKMGVSEHAGFSIEYVEN
ncbi:23S rRNA (adenine(2030)-N(6))-methyltransferase RlmJ [Oceaniserpentilla sp. 4NH20-0058]